MKINDINSLYNTKLLPFLLSLEKTRFKARNTLISFHIIFIPIVVFVVYWLPSQITFMILAGLYALIIWGIKKQYINPYKREFKHKVIREVFKHINKDLEYFPENYIGENVYTTSKLFSKKHNHYKGDDYLTGKIGQTQVEFSELHTEHVYRDSKGNSRRVTIFRGIFFSADFHKFIKGETVVRPDVLEKNFGFLGKSLQSMFSGFNGELVSLENPEFENAFKTISTSQVEARYCLTPSMMEALLEIKKKFNCDIFVSFIGTRMNIALPQNKNWFEPSVWSRTNLLEINSFANIFSNIIKIIEITNMNTRIWTKEA